MRPIARHDDDHAPVADSTRIRHEEWLMDEANRESFPASDPASSSQPGSLAYQRYEAARQQGPKVPQR